MELGRKIKDFRIKSGLTQKEVADLIGCTPGYISQIENNIRGPSVEFIKKFSKILKISTDSIYHEPKEEIKNLITKEPETKYEILPAGTKKLLNNVIEILESGNEEMINILKANIKAIHEVIHVKQKNEDKGG